MEQACRSFRPLQKCFIVEKLGPFTKGANAEEWLFGQ
jgi:hypothetical protein